MTKRSRVVTSTSCPATVTSPVTVTCPSNTIRTTTVPTATLGVSDKGTVFDGLGFGFDSTQQLFKNPVAQLAPFNPFAALAAANPVAALAAKSPALNIFNPAVNPNAALLQFNPAAAPSLALSGTQGLATLPFGKLGKLGKFPFI